MSESFVGEIRMAGFNFAPYGTARCDGQLMAISQNTALFSIIGTYYGGNGTSTFALPNLMSRAPLNQGTGAGLTPRTMGEMGGSEAVTLLSTQLPSHTHAALSDTTAVAALTSPSGNTWGKKAARTPGPLYSSGTSDTTMSASSLSLAGGGAPHNNLAPYLALNFFIALVGIFPSRN